MCEHSVGWVFRQRVELANLARFYVRAPRLSGANPAGPLKGRMFQGIASDESGSWMARQIQPRGKHAGLRRPEGRLLSGTSVSFSACARYGLGASIWEEADDEMRLVGRGVGRGIFACGVQQ